jgi:sugar (pentulose or hexulose) kinase
MRYLFIDYGATHIKCCTYDKEKEELDNFQKFECPKNIYQHPRHEISINEVSNITEEIFKNHLFDAVLMCSQMHGFCLSSDNKILTDYISWKDESGEVFLNPNIKSRTGITPRKGIPVFNINNVVKKLGVKKYKILTLPEAVINSLGSFTNKTHDTMICGLGTHDIISGQPNLDIMETLYESPSFNETVSELQIVGSYVKNNKEIPIYSPVGDMQCALFGAELSEGQISVNLGTGSQVSVIAKQINPETDNRRFFDGRVLNTITHIPSGRAIDCYINFFRQIGYRENFWQRVNSYSIDEILESTIGFDFNVFGSSAGSIYNLLESNLTQNNLEASLIKAYVYQYKKHVEVFEGDSLLLSGGIVKNCPIICDLFKEIMGKNIITTQAEIDETLLGMKKLVEQI